MHGGIRMIISGGVARMRAGVRERDTVWIENVGVNSGVMAGSPGASWFFADNRVETLL